MASKNLFVISFIKNPPKNLDGSEIFSIFAPEKSFSHEDNRLQIYVSTYLHPLLVV